MCACVRACFIESSVQFAKIERAFFVSVSVSQAVCGCVSTFAHVVLCSSRATIFRFSAFFVLPNQFILSILYKINKCVNDTKS